MSWNECLYAYHKKYGGQFLAGETDDAMLILSHKDRPLAVDLSLVSGGRGGTFSYIRARVPVTLARPYSLTVGAKKVLSGGVNAVLKVTSGVGGFSADYGFPEVTGKRLIRSDNRGFTKLVLGSLEFRNALLACPGDRVEVRPGPGEEGLHLITVTPASAAASAGGDWYLGTSGEYTGIYGSEEDKAREARRVEEEFFPRLERFLDLTRAAYNAITQWPI